MVGVLLAGGISWPPFTIFAAVIISAGGHSLVLPRNIQDVQWAVHMNDQDMYAEQRIGERWHIWAVIR